MKKIDLDTEKGNQLLEALRRSGWKMVAEYSPLAFDKGIDFDSYTLRKDGQELVIEWTNWFEWEIRGGESALVAIADHHGLKIREEDSGTASGVE